MELSTTEGATNCAATEELLSTLWNLNVHYRFRKSPPLVSTLSQTNPVHTTLSDLSMIHLTIIHPPTS
jgi:hypothetical protein